jgi:hypothetical protein
VADESGVSRHFDRSKPAIDGGERMVRNLEDYSENRLRRWTFHKLPENVSTLSEVTRRSNPDGAWKNSVAASVRIEPFEWSRWRLRRTRRQVSDNPTLRPLAPIQIDLGSELRC